MLSVEQAVARARAAASGFQGTLRIALSRDLGRARLPALLALCREESPQVNIRLSEVPLTELVQGLNADLCQRSPNNPQFGSSKIPHPPSEKARKWSKSR